MAWYDLAWAKRIPVTLDNTDGPFAISDHQFEIDLSDPDFADLFAEGNADGSDILVTDTNGTTLLDFLLKAYSAGDETGTIVYKVPSLAIDATKIVYVYYG